MVRRFDDAKILAFGGICAATGFPWWRWCLWPLALLAFALVGLGCSNVVPMPFRQSDCWHRRIRGKCGTAFARGDNRIQREVAAIGSAGPVTIAVSWLPRGMLVITREPMNTLDNLRGEWI
jgi:hypothetical protein